MFFFFFYPSPTTLFHFFQKERQREREINVKKKASTSCLPYAPGLGTKPTTLWSHATSKQLRHTCHGEGEEIHWNSSKRTCLSQDLGPPCEKASLGYAMCYVSARRFMQSDGKIKQKTNNTRCIITVSFHSTDVYCFIESLLCVRHHHSLGVWGNIGHGIPPSETERSDWGWMKFNVLSSVFLHRMVQALWEIVAKIKRGQWQKHAT